MALKKDKKQVIGEIFDDARIKTFLIDTAPAGVNIDFHCLERAYRGMKAENFETFIKFFKESGRDINATNPEGRTLLSLVKEHQSFPEYAEILEAAGAR
ncbi:MAG: PA4642 family protein [Pseudomonadales bacterium]